MLERIKNIYAYTHVHVLYIDRGIYIYIYGCIYNYVNMYVYIHSLSYMEFTL